jgi:hypothetical protein
MLEGSLPLEFPKGVPIDLYPDKQYIVKAGLVHSFRKNANYFRE